MAKASKSTRKKKAPEPKDDPAPASSPAPDPSPASDPAASGSATGTASSSSASTESKTRLLDQLGDALLDFGSEAKRLGKIGISKVEKYGKMGLTSADLEREKMALRGAYADLGEKIVRLWDDAPMASVRASDREIDEEIRKVKHMRQRVSELREKLNDLRAQQPSS